MAGTGPSSAPREVAMDVLEHLTQEHRQVESMLEQLRSSKPGRQRDRLIDDLMDALHKHMGMEERFLYPVVAGVVGEKSEMEAETEHDLTREGLTRLDAMRDAPGFGAAVDMMAAGIAHHVKEEEQSIFPQLRKKAAGKIARMDPQQLESEMEVLDLTKEDLYARARQMGVPGRSHMTKGELAEALVSRSR
jgi:hemerythrin superfamily protein